MIGMKGTDSGQFGNIMTGKDGKEFSQIDNQHGGTHTYSIEERTTFARSVNLILKDDADCNERIPMNVEDDTLFHVFDDGILLCKLLIALDKECIDSRALNRPESGKVMNVYQIKENLQMGIAAAKGLGVKMIGVDSRDFIDKVPHMILGCLWQIIRMHVSKSISLKDTPEIMRLANEGEELTDLLKLTPEQLLVRWINYHCAKAGVEKRVKNLGKDLSDSEALFYVLNQLDKDKCSLEGIDDSDLINRAAKNISNS